jgi:outer membrane protein assembly factor BamB
MTASMTLVGILLTAAASQSAPQPCSWPQFHGPNRNNISAETGLLTTWPAEGPTLLWTAKGLGHGFSSISIAAGMIYTAGNVADDTIITALDLDGNTRWQVANGDAWTRDYPGTRATPTIDGDRLYHQSPLGSLICLEAKTGRKIWQFNTLEKFGSKHPKWALAESLLIDGDRLISCPGGPQTAMVALDKTTGDVLWQAPSTGELAGYASPILAEHAGLRIIVTLTAKALIGVNVQTGSLLFHVPHESYADENILMPIFHDGCIFVSTLKAGSVRWKLNVSDGKASVEELWRTTEMDNHHGGVLLLDGTLYGTSTFRNRNLWIGLDWETGEKLFADKGVGKGSITYADGLLYTFSIDRLMGLVRPTPTGLDIVSSFTIPEGGEGKSWPHPVVCGGRLYLRHGQFLYAYDIRANR